MTDSYRSTIEPIEQPVERLQLAIPVDYSLFRLISYIIYFFILFDDREVDTAHSIAS